MLALSNICWIAIAKSIDGSMIIKSPIGGIYDNVHGPKNNAKKQESRPTIYSKMQQLPPIAPRKGQAR